MKKIVFILTAMFVTIAVSAQESQDKRPATPKSGLAGRL